MNEQKNIEFREKNQKTHRKHQQEVLWQITLPFTLGALVIIGLMVLTTIVGIQGNGALSRWADTSLIWLLLPAILFTLIFLTVLSALLYGLVRLIGALPIFTYKVHKLFASVHRKTTSLADKLAEPVIKVESFRASLRSLFSK